MKLALFGLHRGPSIDPHAMARLARLAEEAGFEALWVGDHIALPVDQGDAAYQPRLEALVALTYLAAVTTRVRLGAGVIILPQRQPVLLAKQLASIDVLSGGRLTVGFGVGYMEAERDGCSAAGLWAGPARGRVRSAVWRRATTDMARLLGRFGVSRPASRRGPPTRLCRVVPMA
mgnify:CR=1 FL=1